MANKSGHLEPLNICCCFYYYVLARASRLLILFLAKFLATFWSWIRANPIFRHPPINATQGLLVSDTDSLSIRKLDPSKLTTGTATLPIPMYSGLLFLIHVSPFIYILNLICKHATHQNIF